MKKIIFIFLLIYNYAFATTSLSPCYPITLNSSLLWNFSVGANVAGQSFVYNGYNYTINQITNVFTSSSATSSQAVICSYQNPNDVIVVKNGRGYSSYQSAYVSKGTAVVTCNAQTEDLNTSTNTCDCKPGLERKTDGTCGCASGFSLNDSSICCDTLGRDTSYGVSQAECGSEPFIQVDNLTIITDFTWNECLNICTATSLPPCPAGKVYDSNGYCVSPILDDSNCAASGGSLAPYYFRDAIPDGTIINFDVAGNLDRSKCHNIAICKSGNGTNITDANGDIIFSSQIVSCGTDENSSTPPDDNATLTPCITCPSQYPIPTDAGSCANSNGETTYCPTSQGGGTDGQNDSNASTGNNNIPNNITCGTCTLLGGAISNSGGWGATAWVAGDNGMCKRTTINGITQIASCPTAPQTDNNISITPSDQNASLGAGETNNVCPCCPTGTKSSGGKCVQVSSTGAIELMLPCPCDTQSVNNDGNSTQPLDNNGTEDNATGLQNAFGHDLEREMKKAYKGYTIFDTSDCGQLSVNPDAYLGNPEAKISDPLPLFRDIISPYRNIIKNFLMFMAIIIGLFDFFKRS